jgi:hypothetical protein
MHHSEEKCPLKSAQSASYCKYYTEEKGQVLSTIFLPQRRNIKMIMEEMGNYSAYNETILNKLE